MPAALALVQLIIPLLPTIAGDTEKLIAWIGSIRGAAQQSNEWTPALEASFRAGLQACGKDPAYQP